MRKFITLISTLMLVSMLLAACAGEETSTAVPGTDLPAMTEEPVTEEPLTEEPLETETVTPGEETPDAGIPVTAEEDPSRLSNQLDYDIWNGNGDQIGEVNDMVVDLGESRISYVIAGTGGFLEIGERDVLVPWNQLELQTATDGDVTGDENAFILLSDQEMFENAPDIDVNSDIPGLGEPGADWDVDLRNYWESGVVPGTPEALETPTADAAGDATAMPEAEAVEPTALQGVVLATDLIGSDINIGADGEVDVLEDNQVVGTGTPDATVDPVDVNGEVNDATVEDVIVDIDSGEIRFFVINVSFADGDRWIPVPLNHFQWDAANGSYILDVDQATLDGAPFFVDGQYPDTTVDGWDTEFFNYWQ